MNEQPADYIRLLNARGEVIAALARNVHEAKRSYQSAVGVYEDVLYGACYRCLGSGEVAGGDFSPNITCPVCKGAKRWPEGTS